MIGWLIDADFTIVEFEEKANQLYVQALEQLSTLKMHTIYANFCAERLKLNSKFLNEDVRYFYFLFCYINYIIYSLIKFQIH